MSVALYRSDTIYGRWEIGEHGKVLSVEKVLTVGISCCVLGEQIQDEPWLLRQILTSPFLTGIKMELSVSDLLNRDRSESTKLRKS